MVTRISITFSHQLEVITGNKVLVPGCEPTSALSSTALSSYLAESGCGNAIITLQVALDGIPGSYVKLGSNYNRGNMRQKWLVLPPIDVDCPCDKYVDYYQILRDLANDEVATVDEYDTCDINGMGYCPSPDFDSVPIPPPDPYKDEGTFPANVGVLPPVPPWALGP
jgi:hypothetical protein